MENKFIYEFCKIVSKSWNICIETSLNTEWEHIENIVDYIGKWYIDLKNTNPEIYKRYTDCDSKQVMANYKKLIDKVDKSKIHIRLPNIPNFNTNEDIEKSKEFLKHDINDIEVFDYIEYKQL